VLKSAKFGLNFRLQSPMTVYCVYPHRIWYTSVPVSDFAAGKMYRKYVPGKCAESSVTHRCTARLRGKHYCIMGRWRSQNYC